MKLKYKQGDSVLILTAGTGLGRGGQSRRFVDIIKVDKELKQYKVSTTIHEGGKTIKKTAWILPGHILRKEGEH